MLNTHTEAAVKVPSQSALIDYKFGALDLNTLKYFKGSLTAILSIQIL